MSLNSAAITELTTESGPLNLLIEWIRSYFDGGAHAIGSNDPVNFPVVNLACNQSPAVQPLFQWQAGADTTIRIILIPRNETREHYDTVLSAGYLATDQMMIQFQITSKQATSENAQQSAQTVANLLKAILSNPDTIYDLIEKGLRILSPQPPRPVQSSNYAVRLIFCGAQSLYPVRFGAQPGMPAAVETPNFLLGSISVVSNQPLALIQGEYLLNDYAWIKAVQIVSAYATGFAPQTDPVTLELEVNGVLTGLQLVLPVGAANTEVNSGLVPIDLTVNGGQFCRWKIVSAPDPVASASRASVTMQVLPA